MGILDWFRTLRRPAGANPPAEQIPAGAFGPAALEITPTAPRRSFVDAGIQFDRSLFGDVFSACLAPSTVIQDACAGFVLDAPRWFVDFETGTLSFGENSYPVQFLGSESTLDDTWMWGWNNINDFPPSVLTMAEWMRDIGQQWGLKELSTATFPLAQGLSGRELAMVSTVLAPGSSCYYRVPQEAGAMLLAFSGLPESVFAPVDVVRFARILSDCLQIPCDHRILAESFLAWNGTAYEWEERRIVAHFPARLIMEFDEIMRLTKIMSA